LSIVASSSKCRSNQRLKQGQSFGRRNIRFARNIFFLVNNLILWFWGMLEKNALEAKA
jgi:hypothetical protein